MEKKCNGCGTTELMSKISMSSADWERNEQRHERREKRLVWLIALLVVLLVGSNVGWLIYESQYETISYEQDGEGINNVNIGEQGDLNNGSKGDIQEEAKE